MYLCVCSCICRCCANVFCVCVRVCLCVVMGLFIFLLPVLSMFGWWHESEIVFRIYFLLNDKDIEDLIDNGDDDDDADY